MNHKRYRVLTSESPQGGTLVGSVNEGHNDGRRPLFFFVMVRRKWISSLRVLKLGTLVDLRSTSLSRRGRNKTAQGRANAASSRGSRRPGVTVPSRNRRPVRPKQRPYCRWHCPALSGRRGIYHRNPGRRNRSLLLAVALPWAIKSVPLRGGKLATSSNAQLQSFRVQPIWALTSQCSVN